MVHNEKIAHISSGSPCLTRGNCPPSVGWTKEFYFKNWDDTAFFHSLLMTMLRGYYSDLYPGVQYYCTEYRHPHEASYWKTDLFITSWDEARKAHRVETSHTHLVSCATMEEIMEDAALQAYMEYRARRFEKMKEDPFRFLPRYDPKKDEREMTEPQGLDATTEVMVQVTKVILEKNDVLKEELEKEKKARKRVARQLDEYRTQLKMPKIYEKLPRVRLP